MGKSDSQSEASGEVRYAPYLEAAHGRILDHSGSDNPERSFIDVFNATLRKSDGFSDVYNAELPASPYYDYEYVDIDEGFFGITTTDPTETYEAKNYPSLWDMFGKFMGGLDVHTLWSEMYSDTVEGPEIENEIGSQSDLLQDDIDTKVMPKFLGGMRDINSVMSTAFVIGKAIIQDAHVKSLNKFSSELRYKMLESTTNMWSNHLTWNNNVITAYSQMFKLYYGARQDIDRVNLEYGAKDAMWNISLFENARGILGAMSGNAATATDSNEPSQAQKSIGGAMSGAAAGAMVGAEVGAVGGPVGAAIGGVLGLASSFL